MVPLGNPTADIIPVQVTPVAFEGIDAILKAVEEVDKLDSKDYDKIEAICKLKNISVTDFHN